MDKPPNWIVAHGDLYWVPSFMAALTQYQSMLFVFRTPQKGNSGTHLSPMLLVKSVMKWRVCFLGTPWVTITHRIVLNSIAPFLFSFVSILCWFVFQCLCVFMLECICFCTFLRIQDVTYKMTLVLHSSIGLRPYLTIHQKQLWGLL